jgi:hypothetical protein
MKAISLVLVLFILGCSNEKIPNIEPNNIPQKLLGKWKIVEVFETDGASEPQWRNYTSSNNFNVWFKSDGKYVNSDGDVNCLTGTYSLKNDTLSYFSSCGGKSEVYIELLLSDTMIIDGLNFEPFKIKYNKIISETE